MARLDLTDEECEELVEVLRDAVESDRHRLSPRVRRLRRLLEKLTFAAARPSAADLSAASSIRKEGE
jgi:hypothetical protein